MSKAKILSAIFDCDGTVLDTQKLYIQAFLTFVPPPVDMSLAKEIRGRSDIDVAKIIINHYKMDITPEEFNKKRDEVLNTLLPKSPLIKGVDRVIKKIHEKGIPMAIATSSSRETHEIKIVNNKEIFDLFNATICGDEVTKTKPEPEIFEKASKLLGDFKPENVIVFEDAYYGVVAAKRAGMNAVFLTSDSIEDINANFKELGVYPDVIIREFNEFDFDLYDW